MWVKIRDEAVDGREISSADFLFPNHTVTLREILRARIGQEVARFNAELPDLFRGLVQPEDSEQILNGFRLKSKRPLDVEVQIEKACRSFERNGFLVIAGTRQILDLDTPVELLPGEPVQFLKLVPLIGG